ncbi:hypothetical protein BKA64DRAFT_686478 [Cadophora sp. MPI-SDFR-AT-0126]|nr:hypothetical protein BKA64DRAFT_686478 [Leotiomycetes sp. MPI-SDFR-AT-0126]
MVPNISQRQDLIPLFKSRRCCPESLKQSDELESINESEDAEKDSPEFRKHKTRACSLGRGVIGATSFMLLILAVAGIVYKITAKGPPGHSKKQCGTSPAEVRESGCQFEPMLSAWVPQKYSLSDVVQEYQDKYGDIHSTWAWFWDNNATKVVFEKDFEILRPGNYSVIFNSHFPSHDLHCLYSWRKLSAARERKLSLTDSKTADPFLGIQCAEYVTKRVYQPKPKVESEPEIWHWSMMYHDCVPI